MATRKKSSSQGEIPRSEESTSSGKGLLQAPARGKKLSATDQATAEELAAEIQALALKLSSIVVRTVGKKYDGRKVKTFTFEFGGATERARSVRFQFSTAAAGADGGVPSPGPEPGEEVGVCYDLVRRVCCSGPCPCG